MDIVNGQQDATKHLLLLHEMTDIGTTVVAACGAGASGVEGPEVMRELGVAHVHASGVAKRRAHTSRPRR